MNEDNMNSIKTKFGTARLNNRGYYWITSGKEGNHNKLLHRLIYEDYYNISLIDNVEIHHIDGNKTNNNINNLQVLTHKDHLSLHKKGNCNVKGRKLSEEHKIKISESHKGKNSYKWGTSVIEEWGGLWFLKEMKKQVGTMVKVEEYTGIKAKTIFSYLKRRELKWSKL